MTEIKSILQELRKRNVQLSVNDGKLEINSPPDALNDEMIAILRSHKDSLISYLQAQLKNEQIFDAIKPSDEKRLSYPLSSSQRSVWMLSQFKNGNIACTISASYKLEGDLQVDKFERSFLKLIMRHESLRTLFRKDESGEIKQYIRSVEEQTFRINYLDLRKETATEDRIMDLIHQNAMTPFDLEKGPLLRASLIQIEENTYAFIYAMHHIISDGWSMGVIIKDLLCLYNASVKDQSEPLQPLRIQYKDFLLWHQEKLKGNDWKEHEKYWLNQFRGELPVLEITTDRARPAVRTYRGGTITRELDKIRIKQLKSISQDKGGTLFMGLLTAVYALLFKYTSQEDIIIGSPIAGRDHADLEDQVGLYINTLALRARFQSKDSFHELFENVRSLTLAAYQHQRYPFNDLLDKLKVTSDRGRNALFDVMVALQNAGKSMTDDFLAIEKVKIRSYTEAEASVSKFDLLFNFLERDENICLKLDYNTDVFEKESAQRIADHFEQILAALVAHPDISLNHLDYLSEKEKIQLSETFNDTITTYPHEKTIHALFEEQADKTPDSIALIFENKQITYKELNTKANQLAHHLKNTYHPKADERIGILLKRGELSIIAILGILKAGAAYVPIDVDYPDERKKFIIEDTGMNILITNTDYLFDIPYYNGAIFSIDLELDQLPDPDAAVSENVSPGNLAYVMYTSGSTGMPKGVMIEHKGVVRLVKEMNYVSITKEDHLLSLSNFSFDGSVFDIFGALLNGASLTIPTKELMLDLKQLGKLIEEKKISVFFITTALFNSLVDLELNRLRHLRYILFGGEQVSLGHVKKFISELPSVVLTHVYGPTENTTFSSWYPVTEINDRQETVPIGKAISNSSCYIVDKWNKLTPVGVAGEILVGGEGLARGYLNNEELSRSKFIPHPFLNGQRLYKTGDIGKWLPHGAIEFVGRKDDQVKIRGFRIELGEVQNALSSHPLVDTALVVVHLNSSGEKELVGYFSGEKQLTSMEIKDYLKTSLPSYMLPSCYVWLEKFPLNSNGKIDKKALPLPEETGIESGVKYCAPENDTQRKLAKIWEIILSKTNIGIEDNFFDLGGDSIKAIRLINKINEVFGEGSVSIAILYNHPTISQLSAGLQDKMVQADSPEIKKQLSEKFNDLYLSVKGDAAKKGIHTTGWEDGYKLSSIQMGMLYHSEIHKEMYHDQLYYQFEDDSFDINKFKYAFELLLEKHSILRTGVYLTEFEQPFQVIHQGVDIDIHERIEFKDYSKWSSKEQIELIEKEKEEDRNLPFEFSCPGLWRMKIYRLNANTIGLLFVFHHAILDGWSEASLTTEWSQLYYKLKRNEAIELTPLRARYRDYVIDQESVVANEEIKNFWKRELKKIEKNPMPFNYFPKDHANEGLFKFKEFLVDAETVVQLKAYAKGINLKNIFLSAFLYMLKYTTNQPDITTGLVINGRPELPDGDRILGCFLNTIPFTFAFDGINSWNELTAQVELKTREMRWVDKFPLFEMVQLAARPAYGENPFFDVMFNYLDFHIRKETDKDVITSQKIVSGYTQNNVSLSFTVIVLEEGYCLTWNYPPTLYKEDEIERMNGYVLQILKCIVSEKKGFDGTLLGEAEKYSLLNVFGKGVVHYPQEETIINLFEKQVNDKPDHSALVSGKKSLTYGEVNRYANQLARFIRKNYQLGTNDIVGIKTERSEWMIIAILGILKAGCAYLPVDSEYPEDRIQYMLSDSNCKLLLDASILKQFKEVHKAYPDDNLENNRSPHDLTYIIYTSGSTGKPKGVMITDQALVDYYYGILEKTNIKECRSFGLVSTIAADLGNTVIYTSLLMGGCLNIFSEEDVRSPQGIFNDDLDCLKIVPSHWKALQKGSTPLIPKKCLIFGGEQLSEDIISFIKRKKGNCNVYNHYGPTETTIGKLVKKIDLEARDIQISLGTPIGNTQVYILNAQQDISPIGVVGEICISGRGLSKGYLNKPDLTLEKFVKNPFNDLELIYKTGDLGKWLPDGEIQFIGRKDDQVKIRGYRIEPGEVEKALLAHASIKAAVVVCREDAKGERLLIAYIVSSEELTSMQIRAHLKDLIPDYMIPSQFVQLQELPLTLNGKVDKKSLPDPSQMEMETGITYTGPRNEIEEKLVMIWEEILNKERIGVLDDFFAIGGTSFSLMRVVLSINRDFNVKVSMKTMFVERTIETLAQHINFIMNQDKQKLNKKELIEISL